VCKFRQHETAMQRAGIEFRVIRLNLICAKLSMGRENFKGVLDRMWFKVIALLPLQLRSIENITLLIRWKRFCFLSSHDQPPTGSVSSMTRKVNERESGI